MKKELQNLSEKQDDLIAKLIDKLPISPDDIKFLKETHKSFIEFRRALSIESDRGCALLAVSFIDFQLQNILKRLFVQNAKIQAEIFSATGGLASFSSRIKMCYLLGLITKDQLHDLDIIRKIRNDFGHSPKIISFEEPNIKSRCDALKLCVLDKDVISRKKYVNVVAGLSGMLDKLTFTIKPIEERNDVDLEQRKKTYQDYFEPVKREMEEILSEFVSKNTPNNTP